MTPYAIALMLVCFPYAQGAGAAEWKQPGVEIVGRYALDADGKPRFGWPGTAIRIQFRGSKLDVTLSDDGKNSYRVEVDGKDATLQLKNGSHAYRLVDEGVEAVHHVRLTRRTEGYEGSTTLVGASTDGSFLDLDRTIRKITVIGDSISAGFGVDGAGPECEAGAANGNQTATYAALAARDLKADLLALAWSGRGLTQNYDRSKTQVMPDFIEQLVPGEPARAVLADEQPDVLIVHLGSNDYARGAPEGDFRQAYVSFLERIRRSFPKAQIYGAIGPMLAPEMLQLARSAIESAVASRVAAGDTKVGALFFPSETIAQSWGCSWHPGKAAQQRMGAQLSERIKRDMKW
ncbi:SGNH/GDSL hydrolase family protein [Bosea sp. PAMC 26642]|uniref:SGNH/GDSL hydrolase family protein n=1 Tax=Bosea sp. (strain PAMC 26642) TaxID=1792307 RepID=UPI0007700ADE|nr:SGNH/GDSL hydrolase family protein [Bosea sp. PAMC 26642]AMJ61041.1 hypothetical protein AXW83_12725 [Bosea sp. PAMC 26642]